MQYCANQDSLDPLLLPNFLENALEKAPPKPEMNKTIRAMIEPYAQIFVTVLNSSAVSINAVPAANATPIEV